MPPTSPSPSSSPISPSSSTATRMCARAPGPLFVNVSPDPWSTIPPHRRPPPKADRRRVTRRVLEGTENRQAPPGFRQRHCAAAPVERHGRDPQGEGYRIHRSLIRNAFHGVARRAGGRTTPRCEGWPRRREIECPRPALSSAPTSCAFVSFVVKALSQRTTPSYTNQYAFRRSDAASNRDFEPGFEGPSGVRSLDLHALRVPPPVSPCYGE